MYKTSKKSRLNGWGLSLLAMSSMWALNAKGQQAEGGTSSRQFTIVPSVSVLESYSDNVNLSNSNKQSEFTTQVSPGIRIASNAGRLTGSFDYALTQVLYARNSDKNELQNSLNASGRYEAVDNWAFLDFGSTISQQSISAFGAQSVDNTSINSNRTEVATYRLSPYIRGQFSNLADYEARYKFDTTKSKSSSASDVEAKEASLKLTGQRYFGKIGWSADLNRQDVSYSLGRDSSADRANLNLSYAINSQLDVSVSGGRESNNYISLDKESHSSHGFGLNWRPSDSTGLSGQIDRRYFGSTHSYNIEHRTPRTVWAYTDTKSVATSTGTGVANLGGLYDLLFSQFASIEPDPIKRAQLVRSFLQVNGLNPSTTVVGSFASSSLSLQRSQALSFALMGIRDTITFALTRGNSQVLGNIAPIVSDFANTSVIRQNGLTMSYSHRLTPDSSFNVLLTQQKSAGDTDALQTRLRSVNLNLATRFAEKVYGNFGARHTISDGSAVPYRENSLTGSVNIQF